MTIDDIVEFWIKTAEEDYKTAKGLIALKRYVPALFFCHLTIEKILKAMVVNNNQRQAPYEHKLTVLAKMTGVNFTNKELDLMDEINAFNIKGRYDNYKFDFYKKATKQFTIDYFNKTKDLYLWLKKLLSN